MIALDRAVYITSAGKASSGRGSSAECEDDEVMEILRLLFLQRRDKNLVVIE